MKIEIICQNKLRSDSLRRWINKRLSSNLERFGRYIKRIRVKIVDLNGVRGGEDKACHVFAELKGAEPIKLTCLGSDAYETSATLSGELKQLIYKSLDRKRTKLRRRNRVSAELLLAGA